jgi:hypothetical protein
LWAEGCGGGATNVKSASLSKFLVFRGIFTLYKTLATNYEIFIASSSDCHARVWIAKEEAVENKAAMKRNERSNERCVGILWHTSCFPLASIFIFNFFFLQQGILCLKAAAKLNKLFREKALTLAIKTGK